MLAAVLMGVGAAVWLVGELAAVLTHGQAGEPTTYWVRHFQRRWPWFRLVMWVFLAWLAGHFEFGLLCVRWWV